ncbi:hypothetical protein HanPI659440_Chr05g0191281 [Helianthus annuus]|nr:hypothetical protein HanPI659440_Chr05g0191281 [Helianthus annuus]
MIDSNGDSRLFGFRGIVDVMFQMHCCETGVMKLDLLVMLEIFG